jgi:lipopolysaccharide export system protein LptA
VTGRRATIARGTTLAFALAFALVLSPLHGGPLLAQSLGSSFGAAGSDQPITIQAEEGIEWQQRAQVYIARGNAVAQSGEVTVRADELTAFYRETTASDTEIYRLEARGNVRIATPNENATGDFAIYDVEQGLLVITGDDIRFRTPSETITAEQSLEYWEATGLAVARGNAVADQGGKRLRADVISAHMREDQAGRFSVHRVEAFGEVQIQTATEFVRADYGDYRTESGIAALSGSVKITQGSNQINGDLAEVNLNTGVSRLLGRPSVSSGKIGGGKARVHGIFIPNAKPDGS